MPLEVPKLDDRTFQDLVDEAKKQIPKLCPEWTDHNVSDPGITLIELFAYMTEQYLYRLNQVPEKNYVAFLNLLGELRPPRAARGEVTFTLTRPLEFSSEKTITIKAGTEVATSRSMSDEAIVFTTDRDFQVRPPTLKAILTQEKPGPDWVQHPLPIPSSGFPAWPGGTPATTDIAALALGFKEDLSAHTLAIIFDCKSDEHASDQFWSCEWQVLRSPTARDHNQPPWAPLKYPRVTSNVEGNRRTFELFLPNNCLGMPLGQTEATTWVRCSPLSPVNTPPMILSVGTETRGITVPATHAQVIENEVVGTSDGQAGQSFSLKHHPILVPSNADDGDDAAPHPDEWVIEVGQESQWQAWQRQEYFPHVDGKDDTIYLVDPMKGVIQFAPEIWPETRNSDSQPKRPGAIPARDMTIRIRRYRIGGGEEGNVKAGQISVIKQSLPDIKGVINHFSTWGGRAAQTLEDAKRRISAPARERERLRAVTAEDFEVLAQQVPAVGRAQCLPNQPGDVTLLVIPYLPHLNDKELDAYIERNESAYRVAPQKCIDLVRQDLALPPETSDRLLTAMKPRLLLGTSLRIQEPVYVWVKVEVTITVSARVGAAAADGIVQTVKRNLYRWFHPLYGGVENQGWQLEEALKEDRIWRLIGETTGVEDIFAITLSKLEQRSDHSWTEISLMHDDSDPPKLKPRPIIFSPPPDGIIAAVSHDVTHN